VCQTGWTAFQPLEIAVYSLHGIEMLRGTKESPDKEHHFNPPPALLTITKPVLWTSTDPKMLLPSGPMVAASSLSSHYKLNRLSL